MSAIFRSLKPYRGRLLLALLFILVHTLLGFSLILTTSRFKVAHFPLALVLLFSLHHLLSVFDDWILTDISSRWVHATRRTCLLRFVSLRKKSEKNSLVDWNELQLEIQWIGDSIFSLLRGSLRKLLQLVVFSAALLWLSPILFLFCGILFLSVILLGTTMGRWINRLQEQVIIAQSACTNFELEAARGMPLIRAFRRGTYISQLHDRFLITATSRSILLARLRMITHPIQIVLFLSTLLFVYIVGLSQVDEGRLSQGHFFAFIAGLSLLHAPLSALSQDISTFLSHREMRYLHEIFNMDAAEPNPTEVSPLQSIKVEDLGFGYQAGCSVFQNVNFSISNGEIIGVSGGNGSGKTTLALILAGILQPTKGQITFSPGPTSLCPVSLVDQQGTVFSLSLRENLFLEPDYPLYAERSVFPVFDQLMETYSQEVLSSETLSSGQKKIISFERALRQDHDLYIIDEPENSLDTQAQQILANILLKLQNRNKMIILFSHSESFLGLCTRRLDLTNDAVQPEALPCFT